MKNPMFAVDFRKINEGQEDILVDLVNNHYTMSRQVGRHPGLSEYGIPKSEYEKPEVRKKIKDLNPVEIWDEEVYV
jgi:hypothetical protein